MRWHISWYITAAYLIFFRIYQTTYELYFVFACTYIFCVILVLTNDHFSRDTHMRIILGNKAVLKKSTSDSKYLYISDFI